MIKRLSPLLLLLTPAFALAGSSSDVTVQILPLNCVFETLNDGSNTIQFITPAECGVVSPPVTGPFSDNASASQGSSAATLQPGENADPLQETAPTVIDNGVTITYPKKEQSSPRSQPSEPFSSLSWPNVAAAIISVFFILILVSKLLGFGAFHILIKPILLLKRIFLSLINNI